LGDDYVVEGGISLAEAGEADFDYHWWCWRRWKDGMVEDLEMEFDRAEILLTTFYFTLLLMCGSPKVTCSWNILNSMEKTRRLDLPLSLACPTV